MYKCPRCEYIGNKTNMNKHYKRKVICTPTSSSNNVELKELIVNEEKGNEEKGNEEREMKLMNL